MKLYLGSRDYKPSGFKTVDIDPANAPDIVADITDMGVVATGSVDEIVASHVLEHIEWPDSFQALAEMGRMLKIGGKLRVAVPDMSAMARMLLGGESAFHIVGLMYGMGGRLNPFEAHRYGFTPGMMIDILETLGFGAMDWWNSDFGDASNGWVPLADGARTGMSLNIEATKTHETTIDAARLFRDLIDNPLGDFMEAAARAGLAHGPANGGSDAPKLYQRVHYQLIAANQRIKYLENIIAEKERGSGEA